MLDSVRGHPNLKEIKGDIRDRELLEREIPGTDALIQLTCVSNDPGFVLDPDLGKSINYDAVIDVVDIAKKNKVKRFIYASSASVYGHKEAEEVTEDFSTDPLTDYAKYKAKCEGVLLGAATDDFVVTIVRPSTVCGYSPRLRLDLIINILTNQAVNIGEISVFGMERTRPSIHIEDMTDLYVYLLELPDEKVKGKVYNVGYENYKVKEIIEIVRKVVGQQIPAKTTPSADTRSYRISSRKIEEELGFIPRHPVEDAVLDLKKAFEAGKIPNSMEDMRYYNIKTIQAINLK